MLFALLYLLSVALGERVTHNMAYTTSEAPIDNGSKYNSQSCLELLVEQTLGALGYYQKRQEDDIIYPGVEQDTFLQAISIAKWNRSKITYRLNNLPLCTTLTDDEVKATIREAVETWNDIEEVNLLMTEVTEGEADINISFLPCYHTTGLDNDPQFDCSSTFAHAFYPPVGDIHLNMGMMWSDDQDGNPSLYSIVLHELGHSLGLGHSSNQLSVMYGNFSTTRAFTRLTLHAEDIDKMRDNYPVIDECYDMYTGQCLESYCELRGKDDMRKQCRLTCGLCDPNECKDDYIKCSRHHHVCNDLSTNLRQACRKTCEICSECKPPVISHGAVRPDKLSYDDGETIRYSCEARYRLEGGTTAVCERGRWSNEPTCRYDRDCHNVNLLSDKACEKRAANGKCEKWNKMRKKCKQTCGIC